MIEKMHERANGPVFKIIFALVSVSFVLGGIGGGLMLHDTSAIKVNGEEISQQAFITAKNRQQSILNSQLGERFWDLLERPEYAKEFNDSIINQLVNEELLRQYGDELKLGISAEQIKSEIVNFPAFQRNGKFDNSLYQNVLRNNGLNADGYAHLVSQQMLATQINEGIVRTDFSVPAQQALLTKLLLQKRQVNLASLSLAKEIENQTASESELQAFYDAHQAEFVTPDTFKAEFVKITPAELVKRIQITPEQIENYYQTNLANYTTKAETHLAHIQVATEAEANQILAELNAGKTFEELAKEKSQDKLSAAQGGDLGWTKAGMFPAAFDDAASTLSAGQTSQAVKVDNAYHIIKMIERKDGNVVPLEQVKGNIEQIIRDDLALTEYANLTREMANKAFENNGSLDEVAKVVDAKVEKTDSFTAQNLPAALRYESVEKLFANTEFAQTGQNSDPLEIGDATHPQTLFVRVSQYQAKSVQPFDVAKADVEKAVKKEKAEKALLTQAETQLQTLRNGGNIDATFGDTQDFIFIQAQSQDPALAKAIFAMPKPADNAPTYAFAHNHAGDVLLIRLNSVTDGDSQSANAKSLTQQMEQAGHLSLENTLLQNLREKAKIELNQDFMEQNSSSSR